MSKKVEYVFLDSDPLIDITDYFRLYELEVTQNAEEGSVAQSVIRAHDPDGTLDIIGLAHLRVSETAATGSNTIIGTFATVEREVSRGDLYRTESGRAWDISIVDTNNVLSLRVFGPGTANRPAETDVHRVAWLLATPPMNLVDDDEFFNQSGGVAMDAVNYEGQTPQQLLDDCAQASGKNYFIWYNEGAGTYSLWYDFDSSTSYSSPLRLTNVLADVDQTWTFAISQDTKLRRDPSRVYSGVYLPYDGGAVYELSTDTTYLYPRRDAVMPSLNVKSQAKARARAIRYLDDLDTENDVITTSFVVPAAKVNFLKAGMRVQIRATHLPGYEDEYTWLRCISRTVKELSETDEATYLVTVELTTDEAPAPAEEVAFEATLTIGSASYLGIGADRNQHWASDTGAGTYTLIPGKEYRLVANVITALSIPIECTPGVPRNHDHIEEPKILINPGAGVSGAIKEPTYTWTPGDGTTRPEGHFDGISFFYDGTWTCGDPPYGPGATFEGDWLRFDGPAVAADLSIQGIPISGFYGFLWTVHVRLEERDP